MCLGAQTHFTGFSNVVAMQFGIGGLFLHAVYGMASLRHLILEIFRLKGKISKTRS